MSAIPPSSPALLWTGRVLTALPVLGLLMSGAMKVSQQPPVIESFVKYGYPEGVILPIGILELTAAILCVIPQTAVFGTVLATGYLGGAVATHVGASEGPWAPIVFAVLLWSGIALRDARLRDLLPLRKV